MRSLSDYVVILDDAIPKNLCEEMIQIYDSCPDVSARDTDYYSFSEINMSQHPSFKDADNMVRSITQKVYDFYKDYTKSEFLPTNYGFEEQRIKKYEPNDKDQFDWHTDVGDYSSARRYLVMFYYLNNVEEGGETAFRLGNEYDYLVKPKAGRVICFPPMYMYPHKGMKPISGPKYIISTYGHYL